MEYLLLFFILSSSNLYESSAFNAGRRATPILYLTVPDGLRRFGFNLDMSDVGAVIGVPGIPSHLPEAEPILPGHTLIRPTLGMLKSSIKFPHRELEDGAGVNGNLNNLGIKWDGRNERVLYTSFRRSNPLLDNELDDEVIDNFEKKLMTYEGKQSLYSDEQPSFSRRSGNSRGHGSSGPTRRNPADYIMVMPILKKSKPEKPRYALTNLVLDLDGDPRKAEDAILKRLQIISKPVKPPEPVKPKNSNHLLLYLANDKKGPIHLTDLFKKENSLFTL